MEKRINSVPRWFYEELVEACAAVKNYKNALEYNDRILSVEPQDIDILFTKALLLYKCKRFDEVLKTLEILKKNDTEKLYEKDAEVLYYSVLSIIS